MKERKVYILLTDTGTLLTRLIKFFTKQPLNHASISFDPQLKEVYSFGRKKPINPFIGGFVMEDVRANLFLKADSAIYSCSITEDQYQQMYAKIKEIEKIQHEYRYNLLGLFAVLFNKKYNRKKAYFCSHFVASVLAESGLELPFNKPLSLVTPHDFEKLPTFELVYKGKMSLFFDHENETVKHRHPIKHYLMRNKNVLL